MNILVGERVCKIKLKGDVNMDIHTMTHVKIYFFK